VKSNFLLQFQPILEKYRKIRTPDGVKKAVEAMTSVFTPENSETPIDVIVEALWIVGNHVAGICHHLLHKVWPNFYTIYIRAFQDFYLIPLEVAWYLYMLLLHVGFTFYRYNYVGVSSC